MTWIIGDTARGGRKRWRKDSMSSEVSKRSAPDSYCGRLRLMFSERGGGVHWMVRAVEERARRKGEISRKFSNLDGETPNTHNPYTSFTLGCSS